MIPIAGTLNSNASVFLVRRSALLDALAFGVGFLSFWHVSMVGQLYIVEVAAPLLILLLWPRKHRLILQRPVTLILLFTLIWLIAQVITDLMRSTPWHDLARGWAAISVFALLFMAIYLLVSEDIRRAYWLLFGTALGGVLEQFVQPSPYFAAEPWKFGFGPPLALLLLTWLGYRFWQGHRLGLFGIIVLVLFGAISIYLNARSLGGFVILTAFLIWFRGTACARRILARRLAPGRVLMLALVFLGFAMFLIKSYELAVTRGWLGEHALQKYEMQSAGKLGLLIGGRAELIPAVFAVMDSPIIGHGSWAKDPKYRGYLFVLQDLGYERSDAQIEAAIEESDLIPAHSHILQAWVWAGVLGAAFWVVVLFVVVKALIQTYKYPNPLFIPVIFFGLHGIWDIFFSPFGSMMRFHWAEVLTIFLITLNASRPHTIIKR